MECLNPMWKVVTKVYPATKVKKLGVTGAVRRVKLPCGKCAFCLQSKRSQWMFRIFYEMRYQEHPGWFITLTYNEKHVERAPDGRLSLRFRDVQLFIKKLRKAGYYVKYICVGEYGSETKRPHYHLLLWTSCPVGELENFWSNKDGEALGRIHVGRVSMQSAMYTLKYIIQPKTQVDGIEKTRAQFSKGLGLSYLSRRVYDYHAGDHDHPNFMGMVDGRDVALPRYYKLKIFTRWQCREEARRLSYERVRELWALYRSLRAKGVKGIRSYLRALRVERAKRIISKTKFSEKL